MRNDGSSSRPDYSESSQVTGHSQWLTGMAEPSRTAPDRKPAESSNIVYDVNMIFKSVYRSYTPTSYYVLFYFVFYTTMLEPLFYRFKNV